MYEMTLTEAVFLLKQMCATHCFPFSLLSTAKTVTRMPLPEGCSYFETFQNKKLKLIQASVPAE